MASRQVLRRSSRGSFGNKVSLTGGMTTAGGEKAVSRSTPATNCVPLKLLAILLSSMRELLTEVDISNRKVGDRGAQDCVVDDDVSMLENTVVIST